MTQVRVVLVGCGHLGRFHLHKVMADPAAQLVAVVEPDAGQAHEARKLLQQHHAHHDVAVVPALAAVAVPADACIIATPTRLHEQLVLSCLSLGWHVLVEKPMAMDAAGARTITQAAHRCGRILQVGHLERFNPAVEAALAAVDSVGYFVAERLGPFSGRSPDVDVVLDLMIHDLDLLLACVDAPPVEVRAVGIPVLTETICMASARVVLQNGTVAQLSAGRASLKASRKLRLFGPSGYLSVDCAGKTVSVVRKEGTGAQSVMTGGALQVTEQDALAAQDHSFFMGIAQGTPIRVDGHAGVRVMELADAVKAAMQQHSETYKEPLGLGPKLFE